jgi:hypothetical protein
VAAAAPAAAPFHLDLLLLGGEGGRDWRVATGWLAPKLATTTSSRREEVDNSHTLFFSPRSSLLFLAFSFLENYNERTLILVFRSTNMPASPQFFSGLWMANVIKTSCYVAIFGCFKPLHSGRVWQMSLD